MLLDIFFIFRFPLFMCLPVVSISFPLLSPLPRPGAYRFLSNTFILHFLLSKRQQKKVPKKNAFVFCMYSIIASVLRAPFWLCPRTQPYDAVPPVRLLLAYLRLYYALACYQSQIQLLLSSY